MPTPTDDLITRLRAGTGGGKHWMDLHEEAAAEITRLRAEVAGWRAGYENLIHDNDAVKAELRAEVEAMRKDVERYHFIRENSYVELFCDSPRIDGWKPEHFDARVDLAINNSQP